MMISQKMEPATVENLNEQNAEENDIPEFKKYIWGQKKNYRERMVRREEELQKKDGEERRRTTEEGDQMARSVAGGLKIHRSQM